MRPLPHAGIEFPLRAATDLECLKLKLYRRHGVVEYRIADPEARAVGVWRFAASAESPEIYNDRDRGPARR